MRNQSNKKRVNKKGDDKRVYYMNVRDLLKDVFRDDDDPMEDVIKAVKEAEDEVQKRRQDEETDDGLDKE